MARGEGLPAGLSASLKSVAEHAAVYAAVVASALDAVIVVDETGAVVAINPAAESLFGYGRDEAMGRSIGDLIVPEHLKQAHEAGFARYLASGNPRVLGRRVEMEARTRDGRIIPVELAITEVKLPDRRLFTANLRDLSAARQALAEIERQRDALHQSEKLAALGSLLAGVAHELNNPLSIVLGQATMLREEMEETAGIPPSLPDRARKIEAAAQRCAKVVRSFLAIARQRKPETRSVAVGPLIDEAVELVLYGLTSGGIAVERNIPEDLLDVRADPDQVQQIVVNLLVNAQQALEAIDSGRRIAISASTGPDKTVRIVVADNGPGIPEDIVSRIFDPFFTTKPQGAGTGIGLSVSRGLAEGQGGTLGAIRPNGGRGAAFELALPIADRATASNEAYPADGRPGQIPARRAIVIDDEPEIVALLAEVLGRAGYRCDTAESGRKAQELISAGDAYDAVICDLRMPDVDGQRLFQWLTAHHPALAERTLFLTGDALGPGAGRFLATSGRPVLEKPLTPADIVHAVMALSPTNSLPRNK